MTELISLTVAERIATVTLNRRAGERVQCRDVQGVPRHPRRSGDAHATGACCTSAARSRCSRAAPTWPRSPRALPRPTRWRRRRKVTRPFQELFQRISDLPQVSLAEIGGAAMGGGYELALGCDLRIAANEAKLGLPEPGLGLLPGGGGTQRLTWIAGPAVAARIILTAEAVDGKTARELGMVQWAVPRADLEAEARKLAQKVAGLHPLSLAACKVCIRLARDPERNGFAAETEWTGRLLATEETQKRVADFLAGARR